MGLRRAAAAMIAATLGASLVACSDDDPEPKFETATTSGTSATVPSPSPSTTSAAPTPTGPVEPALPQAATKNSVAGAKAFVRHWVDLVNYSGKSGDVTALQALNQEFCAGCRGLVRVITDAYGRGGHIEGGDWSIGNLRTLPLDFEADVAMYARGQARPQVIVHGDGSATKYAGGDIYLYAYVVWTDSGWRMRWVRSPEARD